MPPSKLERAAQCFASVRYDICLTRGRKAPYVAVGYRRGRRAAMCNLMEPLMTIAIKGVEYWTEREVVEEVGVSRQTLWRWRKRSGSCRSRLPSMATLRASA